jgi:patatin-like phospholipase/acyl hydrolase
MLDQEQNLKTLLSIDGGGALGIGPAEFLARLECLPSPVQHALDNVDAYAGSSVGALLVALKATDRDWREIREIFLKECPNIFAKPSLAWRLNPWKPKYDNKELKAVAQRYFGMLAMSDLHKPVFLTSFDFTTGQPKIWDRTDNVPVWWAVLTSTAAPTYFPVIDNRYSDGGLVANNPSMIGLAACIRQLGWRLEDTRCLSFGTNGKKWKKPKVDKITKIGWLSPLIKAYFDGGEERDIYETHAMLDRQFLRIEPRLRHEYEMDDVVAALSSYRKIWDRLFEEDKDIVIDWLLNV